MAEGGARLCLCWHHGPSEGQPGPDTPRRRGDRAPKGARGVWHRGLSLLKEAPGATAASLRTSFFS